MSEWLGNRLRVLRAERRVTQRTLAHKVGVSQSTFSLWETAEQEPDGKQKSAIAKALGVSVDSLCENQHVALS